MRVGRVHEPAVDEQGGGPAEVEEHDRGRQHVPAIRQRGAQAAAQQQEQPQREHEGRPLQPRQPVAGQRCRRREPPPSGRWVEREAHVGQQRQRVEQAGRRVEDPRHADRRAQPGHEDEGQRHHRPVTRRADRPPQPPEDQRGEQREDDVGDGRGLRIERQPVAEREVVTVEDEELQRSLDVPEDRRRQEMLLVGETPAERGPHGARVADADRVVEIMDGRLLERPDQREPRDHAGHDRELDAQRPPSRASSTPTKPAMKYHRVRSARRPARRHAASSDRRE